MVPLPRFAEEERSGGADVLFYAVVETAEIVE
jgi:hypothetical protein